MSFSIPAPGYELTRRANYSSDLFLLYRISQEKRRMKMRTSYHVISSEHVISPRTVQFEQHQQLHDGEVCGLSDCPSHLQSTSEEYLQHLGPDRVSNLSGPFLRPLEAQDSVWCRRMVSDGNLTERQPSCCHSWPRGWNELS